MSEWKTIPEFPDYLISSDGDIKSKYSGKTLKPKIARGYSQACLYNERKKRFVLIHRLVASSFVENPHGKLEVNHIDGNRSNNAQSNLEWCSRDENLKHAYETGLTPFDTSSRGVVCWREHDPSEKIFFRSIYRAARHLGISQGNICMVCRGQRPLASGYVFRYTD